MILSGNIFKLYKGGQLTSAFLILLVFISLIIFLLSLYLQKKFTRMNRSLYYREELFNVLCSSIDDVFIIYHMGKNIVEYISPNCERTLGLNIRNLKKNPFILLNYTTPEFREEIKCLLSEGLKRSYFEAELEFKNPGTGQLHFLFLRIYPAVNHSIATRYIICISDVTKDKKAKQLLKDALLNAQKANEAKKDFLSHMSHEIRTPINAIIGMTQIASKNLESQEKVTCCLDKITAASKNLLSMVNNVLDMAKIDSNKLLISKEPFDISQFLSNYASMVNSQAEINQLHFNLIAEGLIDRKLLGDALRISQVLDNCISNSLKFTPSGGHIKLKVKELERLGDKALFRFEIIDDGKGMSPEFLDRIFIPFEQEDSQIVKKYGGSGLGMSITKNLVTLLEGNIKVESIMGGGTTVIIDIPFDILNEEPDENEELLKESLPEYDFSGNRILVAEDNMVNLEIICEFLRYTKAGVDTATNGIEALRLFENSEPSYYDIILMDIQMPGIDGYETARRIRSSKHPDAKKIIIVAMSADAFAEDIALTLEAGMDFHLAKPIDLESLYTLLNNILTT